MQVPASICRTFLIINYNMAYSTNRDCDGKAGETTALKEYATTDMRKGNDNPHTGSCTPGRSSKAEVVYIISRHIQYIVIGAQQTTWNYHLNANHDGVCQWPDSSRQGLYSNQSDGSPGWQCNGDNDVPDNRLDNATKVTTQEDEDYRVKPVTDNVPECITSNVKETASVLVPTKRTRAALKLKRRRSFRKMKQRAARVAEETLWREVGAATHAKTDSQAVQVAQTVNTVSTPASGGSKGPGSSNQHCTDFRNRREAEACCIESKSQLRAFIRHVWQQRPCDGEVQAEFDRFYSVIETSTTWESAKQCLTTYAPLEGVAADKVESVVEKTMEQIFWEEFDNCQLGDPDSSDESDYG